MVNYATEAEAQAYFDGRLNTDPWDDASADDRTSGLTMATVIIDRLNYRGDKAVAAQVNQFPRSTDTLVPQDIKDASSEIALALLDGVDPEIEYDNLAMVAQAYGNIKSTYDREIPPEHTLAGVPSVAAWRFLKPYLRDPHDLEVSRVS